MREQFSFSLNYSHTVPMLTIQPSLGVYFYHLPVLGKSWVDVVVTAHREPDKEETNDLDTIPFLTHLGRYDLLNTIKKFRDYKLMLCVAESANNTANVAVNVTTQFEENQIELATGVPISLRLQWHSKIKLSTQVKCELISIPGIFVYGDIAADLHHFMLDVFWIYNSYKQHNQYAGGAPSYCGVNNLEPFIYHKCTNASYCELYDYTSECLWFPQQQCVYPCTKFSVKESQCTEQFSLPMTDFRFCLNYSSIHKHQYFYIFYRQFLLIPKETGTSKVGMPNFHENLYFVEYVDLKPPPKKTWKEASAFCRRVGGFLPRINRKDELRDLTGLLKWSKDMPPVEAVFLGLASHSSMKVRSTVKETKLTCHQVDLNLFPF